jgi:hypothetical protein
LKCNKNSYDRFAVFGDYFYVYTFIDNNVDSTMLCAIQILQSILPLESHLDIIFGIRAKCITETENVVKIILRSLTKQQLIDSGVAHIASKL